MDENENRYDIGNDPAEEIEETAETVEETAEAEAAENTDAANEAAETQAAETSEAEADDAGEAVESGETPDTDEAVESDETAETNNEEESSDDNALSEEPAANPASKKAHVFYLVAIGLLVVAVVVLVIILVNGQKSDEETEAEPTSAVIDGSTIKDSEGNEVTPASEAPETPDEDEKEDNTPEIVWDDNLDYGVTVELGEYKGLTGTVEYSAVSDEDVQAELDSFVSYHSVSQEVTDRTDIREGDTVNIDYLGTMGGEPFDGGEGEGYDLEIGSGAFIPGFEDALIGHNNGESFDINLTFPDDYHNAEYAGKDVVFAITVNSISETVLPELTDALIAENTEYTTVEDYKNYLRDSLLEDRKSQAEDEARSNAVKAFVDSCTFGGGIDQEIKDYTAYNMALVDQQAQQAYGMDGATLYSYLMGWTKEEYEENMKERCSFAIKYQNALDEIIKKENLTLTTEEYDDFFNSNFIDGYGYASKEEVLEDYTQEEIDDMINTNALRVKAENLIYDNLVLDEKVNSAG